MALLGPVDRRMEDVLYSQEMPESTEEPVLFSQESQLDEASDSNLVQFIHTNGCQSFKIKIDPHSVYHVGFNQIMGGDQIRIYDPVRSQNKSMSLLEPRVDYNKEIVSLLVPISPIKTLNTFFSLSMLRCSTERHLDVNFFKQYTPKLKKAAAAAAAAATTTTRTATATAATATAETAAAAASATAEESKKRKPEC